VATEAAALEAAVTAAVVREVATEAAVMVKGGSAGEGRAAVAWVQRLAGMVVSLEEMGGMEVEMAEVATVVVKEEAKAEVRVGVGMAAAKAAAKAAASVAGSAAGSAAGSVAAVKVEVEWVGNKSGVRSPRSPRHERIVVSHHLTFLPPWTRVHLRRCHFPTTSHPVCYRY